MASGLPVLAFDVSGERDAMRHIATGLLAAVGDTTGFGLRMAHALSDAGLRSRLGLAARTWADRQRAGEPQAFLLMRACGR